MSVHSAEDVFHSDYVIMVHTRIRVEVNKYWELLGFPIKSAELVLFYQKKQSIIHGQNTE